MRFHCVKVDDAVPGICKGLNAGMWSEGLALPGVIAEINRRLANGERL